MIELNFAIDSLDKSQCSFYLINELCKHKNKISPLIFVSNITILPFAPPCPVLHAAEAWGQEGIMITTTPATTFKCFKFPRLTRRIFYLWDLYYLRGGRRVYEPYLDLFSRENLEIVVRSESHKRAVENCFNVQVKGIVDNFNMDDMLNVLNIVDDGSPNKQVLVHGI